MEATKEEKKKEKGKKEKGQAKFHFSHSSRHVHHHATTTPVYFVSIYRLRTGNSLHGSSLQLIPFT